MSNKRVSSNYYFKKKGLEIWSLLFFIFCTSCFSSGNYEKRYAIKNNTWSHNDKKYFEFNIDDTITNYNIYFLIRHTNSYSYSNIWLAYDMTDPSNKTNLLQLEINLQNPDGTWLGRHFYNTIEQKMNITPNSTPLHFNKKGKYKVAFGQSMRDRILSEVLNVGLHVEKIQKQKF